MNKTILVIISLALVWHLSIILIKRFIISRGKGPSLGRLLRLIELELVRELHSRTKELSKENLRGYSRRDLLEETKNWIKRIEDYYE